MNKKITLGVLVLFCFCMTYSNPVGAFFGKDKGSKKETEAKQEPKKEDAAKKDEVVARVGSHTISAAELNQASEKDLMPLATQIYQIKKQRLDQMVQDILFEEEAKQTNKSVDEIKKGMSLSEVTISDDAVEVYYDTNQARYSGKTLDQVKTEIRQTLISQKKIKGQNQILADLKKKYPTEIYLQEPKIEIETAGHPSRGPQNAKVTIVEFSEFQCPFCKKFKPTIDQIAKEYPNDVRHVFYQLPLGFHDKAKGAARAAICADRQGKFWELRDVAFDKTPAIEEANLRTYAEQIGLDMAKYDACVKDPAVDKQIDQDLAYAAQVGARGTPTSFVNGVLFSGARPYEELKRVVDEKISKN